MTKTRLIGDIHGRVSDYISYSISDFKGPTIQIGDFGIGFLTDYWQEKVNKLHSSGLHRFIRGNHDKPSLCKSDMIGYIPDGTIENDVMFVGGAWSIDNPDAAPGWYQRTEDLDWWVDEECSGEEFERFVEIYSVIRPRVMITHDCPSKVSKEMFFGSGINKGPHYKNRTGQFFDRLLEIHQPDEWYFGHWHINMQYKYGRTIFQCIGECKYVDIHL